MGVSVPWGLNNAGVSMEIRASTSLLSALGGIGAICYPRWAPSSDGVSLAAARLSPERRRGLGLYSCRSDCPEQPAALLCTAFCYSATALLVSTRGRQLEQRPGRKRPRYPARNSGKYSWPSQAPDRSLRVETPHCNRTNRCWTAQWPISRLSSPSSTCKPRDLSAGGTCLQPLCAFSVCPCRS